MIRQKNLADSLNEIFNRLAEHFGPLHWWPAESPFEVVVGAILTQNAAWRNVELAIAALKEADALSPSELVRIDRQRLESLIRPAGFFRQKAERLKLFADFLQQCGGGDLGALLAGPLEQVRAELLSLKGIGPETADSILLYAGDQPSFVVDAYTCRLLTRLGLLCGDEKYEAIRALFMDHLPHSSELFNEFHALIVEQCKTFCRVKPLCGACPLRTVCTYFTTSKPHE